MAFSANSVVKLDEDAKAYEASTGHPFRTAHRTVRTISGKRKYAGDIMPADLHLDAKGKPLPKPVRSVPGQP